MMDCGCETRGLSILLLDTNCIFVDVKIHFSMKWFCSVFGMASNSELHIIFLSE